LADGNPEAILGPAQLESELAMRTGVPGVATGLAWTPVGGGDAASCKGEGFNDWVFALMALISADLRSDPKLKGDPRLINSL
jgi:hypothetical protein